MTYDIWQHNMKIKMKYGAPKSMFKQLKSKISKDVQLKNDF